ncbi:MAG: DUF1611 domain-containing protein [Marinicaulis sp.]|nr:DUF1611 domain-containing protein [Marinicaulis sp.]
MTIINLAVPSPALKTPPNVIRLRDFANAPQVNSVTGSKKIPTAIVYCEANFGAIDGKTANGLVRQSEKYQILSVIDSQKAGQDSGFVLDNKPNSIPILRNLADALTHAAAVPDYFIFGIAPASGMLSAQERALVLEAIGFGMNIVNGLHEFLNDDPEFAAASAANDVELIDVRKPRDKKDLRQFSDRIAGVTCPRIAVLGTDCAIGKRTTATILTAALNERGLNAVLVGTGQTGLMQGARYGVALDAVPSQFCSGEMEAVVVEAFEGENPDIIIIEGQGALSHPAYSTSSFILRGSRPHAVILQHAPHRAHRCDFEKMAMPTPASEINLIQIFGDTKVIGLTINHENMTDDDVDKAITLYEAELGVPVTDALTKSSKHLVQMVLSAFPELEQKLIASTQ